MDDVDKILAKARKKLGRRIEMDVYPGETFSREYKIFRKEALDKKLSRYENLCNKSERILKVKIKEKDKAQVEAAIKRCHLNMSADGASSFASLFGLGIVLFGLIWGVVSFLYGLMVLGKAISIGPFVFPLLIMLIGVLIIKPLTKYPLRLAAQWRLKASNQMVLCILYIVMYMRHTSNLEHAIKFAGEHIGSPLALDLRKLLWDVEIGKYVTLKESLDNYLYGWKDTNLEFVESFHLIESSLYEKTETRRISLLDKALQVMLEGTYEKMLHYAHDLKSPITMLHMLGVILPILGLVIFPLLGTFMGGMVQWWHLAALYNLILPAVVFYFGSNLLAKRPTGYSESEVLTEFEKRKYVGKGKYKVDPLFFAVLIIFVFCFLGLLPLILHYTNPSFDFSFLGGKFLDFKSGGGPFGVGALLMSLLVPLGFALGLSYYYRQHTKDLIKFKRRTNKLEQEFSGALFQLGNRVGEGIPVEVAFSKVANNMVGTPTGNFLRRVSINLKKMGMGVKEAIFDSQRGAIVSYPSALIESSMKVLVEAAKKGPKIVSKSLITISNYVREIHRVNERLKDLLADIISSMKSQIAFLTPMIAGIVVGVSSMIVTIINKLSEQFATLSTGQVGSEISVGGVENLIGILNIKDVIPSFYFQLIVGIYLVEIVIILTILSNGIERGVDKVTERYSLSKNLLISVFLYCALAFFGIIVFNFLASGISTVTTGL